MFERLIFTNFQAHKKSEIVFEPDVSIIIGSNDSNKSGVVRALDICLFNAPYKEEYIHYGEKESQLELIFSDGRKVIRRKTKSKNTCEFVHQDGKTEKFSSIAKIAPKLAEFTGFDYVKLDGSKPENLQIVKTGESNTFVLGVSAETIKKKLASILSTTPFEQAKKEFASSLTQKRSNLKYVEEKKGQITKIVSYLNSPSVSDTMEELCDFEERAKTEYKTYMEALSMLSKFNKLNSRLDNLNEFSSELDGALAFSNQLEEMIGYFKIYQDSLYLLDSIESNKQRKQEVTDEIKDVEEEIKRVSSELDKVRCQTCGKLVKCYE